MKSTIALIIVFGFLLAGCDRVGSEAWCEKQSQKPKSDWTLEEGVQYTEYCVLGMDSEKWCKDMEKKSKADWSASEAADYAKNCLTGRSE